MSTADRNAAMTFAIGFWMKNVSPTASSCGDAGGGLDTTISPRRTRAEASDGRRKSCMT